MIGELANICRHPIKSHGREDLASVLLSEGQSLPWDRHWAVAHDAAKLVPGWNECVNFARGSKAPGLMAIGAALNEADVRVTLNHPEKPDFSFCPDDTGDLAAFLDWVRPLNPQGRAQPVQIVKADRGMTDTDYPSVSIFGLASNRALSEVMGVALSPYRWRGNLWIEGTEPWAEFGWIGKTIRIGTVVLQVEERIVRCRATTANPATGLIDADTLAALNATYGHQDFGIYARVIKGGTIALKNPVEVL
ncbi:MAG: MOSC domain-containing protein [Paracoccaceae bacterium]